MAFAPLPFEGTEPDTVHRLAHAIEGRDPRNRGHLERVGAYCALLAERLGLDPGPLRAASALHDIGNVGVPEAILLKPDALTAAEREVVRRHARVGHDLLLGSDLAATIALTHHEHYDGAGYPNGLAGARIPEAGRIVAVADALDALTHDRPYRAAAGLEEAVAVIGAQRGRQFDPTVVDALLEDLDPVQAILAEFPAEQATPASAEPQLISMQEAAASLGITTSRLRRWADAGRIESVRTAGGHRRFPVQAIRDYVAEHQRPARVRRVDPPDEPLHLLARILDRDGLTAADIASTALYHGGAVGWFAREQSRDARRDWVQALATAARTGHYDLALRATGAFARQAELQACGLLERYTYVEHFGRTVLRLLVRSGAAREPTTATRRLFVTLQQTLLEHPAR